MVIDPRNLLEWNEYVRASEGGASIGCKTSDWDNLVILGEEKN